MSIYAVSDPMVSRSVIVYESPVSRNVKIAPTLIKVTLSALSCVSDSIPENNKLSEPIE